MLTARGIPAGKRDAFHRYEAEGPQICKWTVRSTIRLRGGPVIKSAV